MSVSAFKSLGIEKTIEQKIEEIQSLYQENKIPWVIGYSGGKDSTAVTQLTWMAINQLPPEERMKPIYVITTDTMVENPVVSSWVESSLCK
jgi:DNA sulfur modification protein DndC